MIWDWLIRRKQWEQKLDAELRFHVEEQIRNYTASGDDPEQARRKALLEFGGLDQIKEDCRDAHSLAFMDTLLQDIRYGFRMLRKSPGFTAVVICTLALGIGANTAIFSVINAVLLKPLPFKDPARLAIVWETDSKDRSASGFISSGNFSDWKDRVPAFEQAAGWQFWYFNLAGTDEPEQVQGLRVSASFLPMLGAQMQLGRAFGSEEERPGRERVAVLSDALWHRQYGADRNLIGRTINLEDTQYTVVGILSPAFHFFQILNRPIDIYVPLALDPAQINRRTHDITVYARLRSGDTLDQAQAQLGAVYRALGDEFPETNSATGARVVSLPESGKTEIRPVLLLLLAAVGLVLLICCANVANLMLARAAVRSKEMAVRSALGAAPGRLLRQVLTEGLILALLGGISGAGMAGVCVRVLNHLIPYGAVNRLNEFQIDPAVFGFTLIISVASGVIFSLSPALQFVRSPVGEVLKEAGHRSRGSARTRRLGNLIMVSEVALAMTLLSGALLLIRSAVLLQGTPRGLDLNNVLTMQIWLPKTRYPEAPRVTNFYHEVLQRIRGVPGVESASAINFTPLALQDTLVRFNIKGRSANAADDKPLVARYSVIDPQYFRSMRIPLLAGRPFTDADADETHGVVIVSASMARRFWPNSDPIGLQIQPQFPRPGPLWNAESKNLPLTIVGIVGDVREDGPVLQGRNLPLFYLPYLQNPSTIMHLVIRTTADPLSLANAVRGQVWSVDRDQPVFDVKTMEDVVAETFGRSRIMAGLTGSFGAAALLLAAIGIYGLLSYSISNRTHEIGIRMALGASHSSILTMVVRQGGKLTLAGTMIGSIASLALTRFMASLLYGVTASDPLTFSSVAVVLIGVGALATYIPARRAAKVDPMIALRAE